VWRSKPAQAKLYAEIQRNRELRLSQLDPDTTAVLKALRVWQYHRLHRSFADIHAQARYRNAVDFFLVELYSAEGFAPRDAELQRIVPIMVRLLPEHLLETVARALHLQALSQELDVGMAHALHGMGVSPSALEAECYARAYRQCDNRPARELQIRLIQQVGCELDSTVDKPFVMTALRLCRVPARAAGLGNLQHFLESGFSAFRTMHGAQEFLRIVVQRETRLMEKLFAGDPAPFEAAQKSAVL